MKNPIIDLSKTGLQGRDLEIAQRALGRDGRLRATKPKLDDDTGREGAFVWRMAAFQCSVNNRHWCMPVTAEFDLPEQYWDRTDVYGAAERRRARIKELDAIVKVMVDAVPERDRHGINRWARALGV